MARALAFRPADQALGLEGTQRAPGAALLALGRCTPPGVSADNTGHPGLQAHGLWYRMSGSLWLLPAPRDQDWALGQDAAPESTCQPAPGQLPPPGMLGPALSAGS